MQRNENLVLHLNMFYSMQKCFDRSHESAIHPQSVTVYLSRTIILRLAFGNRQWRPGVFRQGGQQQNGAPSNQTSSLTRLAALAIFPTFVMVLFDTLTWSRAECRHLIDLGEREGLGVKQPPGKFFVTMPFKLLENKGLVLSDVFWCRKTFLPTFYILCTKKRYFTSASIFSDRSCFIDTLFF